MKVLIAIKSCRRDCRNGFNQAVRNTWLHDCPVDYRFFVGNGDGPLAADEELLGCGDAYMDLPHKTRAICAWAFARDYDHAFMADTDTYANVPKLLASGFQEYDVTGYFNGPIGVPGAVEGKYAWVSGGAGYWVSRRVMEMLAASEPSSWAEDLWVGQVVGEAVQHGQLTAKNHPGYGDNNEITSHYCSATKRRAFDVSWMYAKHKEHG